MDVQPSRRLKWDMSGCRDVYNGPIICLLYGHRQLHAHKIIDKTSQGGVIDYTHKVRHMTLIFLESN